MAIARIGGRWQRHRNVMVPMRIADCRQDTASLQEPRHGENFSWAWQIARGNRLLCVANGQGKEPWKRAATEERLRHVVGGKEAP